MSFKTDEAGHILGVHGPKNSQRGTWRNIESAPKDGSYVLLGTTIGRVRRPVIEGQWWVAHAMWSTDWTPTHWQPLPEPPEARK